MTSSLPLYIACPCHSSGNIPDGCSKPAYWYHSNTSCPYSNTSQYARRTKINNKLELECSQCSRKSHIKNNLFYCDTTNTYKTTTAANFSNVLRSLGQIIGDTNDTSDLDFLINLKTLLNEQKNNW